jgi:hypothetical protein
MNVKHSQKQLPTQNSKKLTKSRGGECRQKPAPISSLKRFQHHATPGWVAKKPP